MTADSLEKIARNKNVARAAARQLSMEQLHKLSEVINEVIEQKAEEDEQRREEEIAKERKLAEIRDAMIEAGLSRKGWPVIACDDGIRGTRLGNTGRQPGCAGTETQKMTS